MQFIIDDIEQEENILSDVALAIIWVCILPVAIYSYF